jgi:hypothetical protein
MGSCHRPSMGPSVLLQATIWWLIAVRKKTLEAWRPAYGPGNAAAPSALFHRGRGRGHASPWRRSGVSQGTTFAAATNPRSRNDSQADPYCRISDRAGDGLLVGAMRVLGDELPNIEVSISCAGLLRGSGIWRSCPRKRKHPIGSTGSSSRSH